MNRAHRRKLYQHFYTILLKTKPQKINEGHYHFEFQKHYVDIYSIKGVCTAILSIAGENQTIELASGEIINTQGYLEVERFACSGWRDGARQSKSYLLGIILKSRGFKIKDIHP